MTTSPAIETAAPAAATHRPADYVWAVLRIALGWVFLWAFLDKALGLGFATEREAAWIEGGSPTEGFLAFGTRGPFADFYQGMAGAVLGSGAKGHLNRT